MPGRVFLTDPPDVIAATLGEVVAPIADEKPRYNIAPGQEVVALTVAGLTRMRWGMIPVGRVNARGRPVMKTIVNARSETVFDKSAFAGVGRAVLPVNGWYEWTGEKGQKTPHAVLSNSNENTLWFAGLASRWDELLTCTIMTRAANADVADIHHRMPVILNLDERELWLSDSDQVQDLGSDARLQDHQVRSFGVRDDGPELIEPF